MVLKMNFVVIVHLCSDDGLEKVDMKSIKLEPVFVGGGVQDKNGQKASPAKHQKSMTQSRRQESEDNRSSNAISTGQSSSSVLEQGQSPVDDSGVSSASTICSAPICRQFWKAGNYDDGLGSKVTLQSTQLLILMLQLHDHHGLLTSYTCYAIYHKFSGVTFFPACPFELGDKTLCNSHKYVC